MGHLAMGQSQVDPTGGRPGQGQLQGNGAPGIHHEAVAVKHQFIVAPHLVHVSHRTPQAGSGGGGQLPAQRLLAHRKGGGGEIHHHVRRQRRQFGDGVTVVGGLTVAPRIDPEVFADGDGQPQGTPRQGNLHQAGPITRTKIPPLVEHVVTGEEPLGRHHPPAAVPHQGGTVVEGAAPPVRQGDHHTHQHPEILRQGQGQGIQHLLLPPQHTGQQQQIPGGIPPERQFRRHQHLDASRGGLAGSHQHLTAVALQVPHQGIELRQADAEVQRHGQVPFGDCRAAWPVNP